MNNPLYKRKKDIEKHGLYDPLYEHDACGMGAICHIDGEQSHYIIEKALEILFNLEHRGARGSDVETFSQMFPRRPCRNVSTSLLSTYLKTRGNISR